MGIDDGLRDALVGEEMLAEGLLRAYFHINSVNPAKILIYFCYFCKLQCRGEGYAFRGHIPVRAAKQQTPEGIPSTSWG